MKQLRKYFLLLLFIPAFCFSQDKKEELIEWAATRQLAWSDYKGRPDLNSDAAALTTTYLGIEYHIEEKNFSWKIQCRFSKTKSWGQSKTDHILQHEQGHFDIAEIFARKLNKKLREYSFNNNSFRKDLKDIYDGIADEKGNFQDQYDRETDHSRKKELQGVWQKKIELLLKELEPFSKYD